jgi:hypothetical protein
MHFSLKFLTQPTRHLFFTGKKVLRVSTDAASNLEEMLGVGSVSTFLRFGFILP